MLEEATQRGQWAIGFINDAGERLGLQAQMEYPVPGGRVDVVWLWPAGDLGFGLPPSSYRHAAHWSSYEGSAVVRAIKDAGWTVEHLDLRERRVTLISGAAH